jgi:hypothetical protein
MILDAKFRPLALFVLKDFKIICLPNLLTMKVPGEGYSRDASSALN